MKRVKNGTAKLLRNVELSHNIVDSNIAKGTCSSFKDEGEDCRRCPYPVLLPWR